MLRGEHSCFGLRASSALEAILSKPMIASAAAACDSNSGRQREFGADLADSKLFYSVALSF